jgi:hypothetical protein
MNWILNGPGSLLNLATVTAIHRRDDGSWMFIAGETRGVLRDSTDVLAALGFWWDGTTLMALPIESDDEARHRKMHQEYAAKLAEEIRVGLQAGALGVANPLCAEELKAAAWALSALRKNDGSPRFSAVIDWLEALATKAP